MGGLAFSTRFTVTALAWGLGLFGFLRLGWVEQRLVQGLIDIQQTIALWYGAVPSGLVVVDASCSGADLVALCLAVTLAYPVSWNRRLAGAAGGAALLLALNTIRIGSLTPLIPERGMFDVLHRFVWPTILGAGACVYVLAWTSRVSRETVASRDFLPAAEDRRGIIRFIVASVGLLALHAAAAPWTYTSSMVLRAGVWTASSARWILAGLGLDVSAQGSVIQTSRGAFQVTQECLLTPLLPLYIAAALTFPLTRRTRWVALLLALPIFLALGVLRVLVLALPPVLSESPLFLAHGFYQLAAGAALLCVASIQWQAPDQVTSGNRIALSVAGASAAAFMLGGVWQDAVMSLASAIGTWLPHVQLGWIAPGDQQGALALLPRFQFGLFIGLVIAVFPAVAAKRWLAGLAAIGIFQVLLLVSLGELGAHTSLAIHALFLRGLAIAVPVAAIALLLRLPDRHLPDERYRRFWDDVGADFPDLGDAASTRMYFDDEVRLLTESLSAFSGVRLLKSDLWDEAKNTRILQWAAAQGAEVFGIDIARPIITQARANFGGRALHASQSDVRALPFADCRFDAIYSMGTVEHFDETERAIGELVRVLAPGGRLILGVPNRRDPFLRPLLVAALYRCGLYDYGFEKSYSRRQLRTLMEDAGLTVSLETAILFIPGWLRMADLLAHTRGWRWLEWFTSRGVALFAWLGRQLPACRRHGYLLATVGIKRSV